MTELIWDGKYKDGKKVGPVHIELPFQTVETVNESARQRQLTLDMLFTGRETEWRNRLIWGDKKYVLPSLLSEFGGKVNLIYIDPPILAWRRTDPDAATGHAPAHHPRPLLRGYRVHTLLCRGSGLPVHFLVSPANCHDAPFARR